jgi:membrane-bound lytic murein transglycosylase B
MVDKHQFEAAELNNIFSQVELMPKVIEAMNRPAEKRLNWSRYRNIFLKEKRINLGAKYWQENAQLLQRAEKKYGVPSEIIVAIIGVESRFGKHKGKHKVINSLTTLAIDYPRRAKFFTSELKAFLLLAKEEGFDPLQLKGSYAGALGKPQFISSSYRAYAVDFDGDGRRDLINNSADVIGSVANYFKRHGWRTGEAITVPAQVQGDAYQAWVKKGIKPKVALRDARSMGVSWDGSLAADEKSALIELEKNDGMEYWLGLKNFYVISRYNHSQMYSMAVYQLAQEIRKRHEQLAQANL